MMPEPPAGDKRPVVHMLRIGKTGTTALEAALASCATATRYRVVVHGHDVVLSEIPEGERFFFAVRDPISRFASGFRSRQRRGRPRYDNPHTAQEAVAFARFNDPWELGEALSSSDPDLRVAAVAAMHGINHVRTSLLDWFGGEEQLRRRADDCLIVLRQEHLAAGCAELAGLLGVRPQDLALPTDPVTAHRSPLTAIPDQRPSPTAARNLRQWYSRDYEFLQLVDESFPPVALSRGIRSAP